MRQGESASEQLGSLFRPQRIAIVGATDKSYFSQLVVENLDQFGFGDRLHLVNPRNPSAHGRATVPTLADIDEQIDLAFTMVPQAATLDVLTAAATAGIRNAVIMTSGYAEASAARYRGATSARRARRAARPARSRAEHARLRQLRRPGRGHADTQPADRLRSRRAALAERRQLERDARVRQHRRRRAELLGHARQRSDGDGWTRPGLHDR